MHCRSLDHVLSLSNKYMYRSLADTSTLSSTQPQIFTSFTPVLGSLRVTPANSTCMSIMEKTQRLHPTTSQLTTRYEKTARVTPEHKSIPARFLCHETEHEPRYLPFGWSEYIHPEGQAYFACESRPRVVTEEYLYSPAIQEKITHWTGVFHDIVAAANVQLPDTVELFLALDGDSDSCRYYLVDYVAQVEFWIEEQASDVLGLPATVSDSHLKNVLHEHFWLHVEHFPSHRHSALCLNVTQLVDIFIHAQADNMTSAFSTFPYGATECAQYVGLLQAIERREPSSHSICVVARLWALVYNHRYTTHYGEEHSRLSRDQRILDIAEVKRRLPYALLSRMLFNIPNLHLQNLDALYIDQLVYIEQWRKFIRSCRSEWKLYGSWTFALAITNTLLLMIPSATRAFGWAALSICNIGILSSVGLLVTHDCARDFFAMDAANYLSDVQRERSGFQKTALAYSLPKALFLWALLVTSARGFERVLKYSNTFALGGMLALIMVVCLCLWLMSAPFRRLNGVSISSLCPKIRSWVGANRRSDSCVVIV
ncbi:hypothetical protein WOLCODRAFT_139818 [Wolfiporia cocos MD-104 SS10]|uniref:WW domain-containing protein n=1 Tax=Wolfiporia cocos (strain MD-104) TaxID=742152 RepID=A0A2H3IZ62_WOLCO|nr:hypothetical protein WOLCODRAFT_139818 [Wolfiporia cocos MD-104 SS10]